MIRNEKKKIRDLSHYEFFTLMRMKSLRELRSIEIIMKDDNFLSISNKRSLISRLNYLKLKYNL